jgi:hypothetical protein
LRVRRRLVLGSCGRDARWFGEAESGEVSFGAFAEGRHEAAVVAGAGGQPASTANATRGACFAVT